MASTDTQMMVSMNDLRDLVNAAAEHYNGNMKPMSNLLHYQADPSNPIVKLRNQYMAAIELCHAEPVDGVQ